MLKTTYLHSGWEFAETSWQAGGDEYLSSPGWLPAEVPGHVHLDLVRHGIIADPFAGMNELGCQWVDEKDWSYRISFEWSPDPANPRRVLLFEGLDTVCTLYLNDEKLAEHDNMFLPLEVDVTDMLVAGTNTVRIEFQSAVRVGRERRSAYFKEVGLPEDTERFHERPFVRKAQYMSGWDWGPRLVSCGIWKPVRLIEFSSRITAVEVESTKLPDRKHRALVKTEVFGEGSPRVDVLQGGRLGGGVGTTLTLELEDLLPFETSDDEERIPGQVLVTLLDDKGDALDQCSVPFGYKDLELLREPDEYGESFEFRLNGRPFWARGANWIPDHSFPSTITREQYRDRLQKAKDMGFNMLRIWGGGLYESDDFYDLCDEIGILVWQDFPFACSYYPDTGEWLEVIRKEAEFHIKRLRNHPCLALWCGNNENEEMNYSKWGDGSKHPPRYYGENLYNDVLPDAVKRLDPKTPYIRTSPIGNAPVDDPVAAKQRGPNSGGYGDQHCWDVWHGRGDWRFYADSTGRFSSEYGFASSCSLAVWDKVLDDWAEEYPFSTNDPVLRWHDKTRKGYETFVGYSELHYPKSKTLADWVYYSQLNQRDALRFGIEHYRRSQFCKGSLIWQLNDCWPVQSWAILDSDGNYKALAYELRRTYADRLLSIERHNDQIKVHAINDGAEDWDVTPILTAYPLGGGAVTMRVEGQPTKLAPSERKVVVETSVKGLSVPETLLMATSGNAFAWHLLDEPKNARFQPPAPITASLGNRENTLTISVDQPVVDLMFTDEDDVANFRENFVTLPQGGRVDLAYLGSGDGLKARSLAGWHEVRLTRSPI